MWGAVIGVVFVPIYIRYLGMEAYGLIGISAAIFLIFALSDFGFSAALTREMARGWKDTGDIAAGRSVLETLTRLYIPLAVIFGGIVVIAAPYIAAHWITSKNLPTSVVETSIRLIGVIATLQLVGVFYSAGLLGLQKHVLANLFGMGTATVQVAGTVMLLAWYDADIVGVFWWQAGVTGVNALVLGITVSALVPGRGTVNGFDRATFRRIRRFAFGMSGISLLSIVLTQTDKVVLSRLLNLEDFGYYSLGVLVAMSLRKLFGPLFAAVYPRFTEIVRANDTPALTHAYHLTSQAMSVVVLPASLLIILFSAEVVFVWTGDAQIANRVHLLISLLVTGTALTGLTQTPYALQLAHGWTKLALVTNTISAVVFVPAVYLLGKFYGGEGAALAWLALNLVYAFIQTPIMHKRILPSSLGNWYWRDTLIPGVVAALPIVAMVPLAASAEGNRVALGGVLALGFCMSTVCAVAAARDLQSELRRRLAVWSAGT